MFKQKNVRPYKRKWGTVRHVRGGSRYMCAACRSLQSAVRRLPTELREMVFGRYKAGLNQRREKGSSMTLRRR